MGDRKKLRQEADEKMLKDLVLKNRSYRGFDESVRISRETLEGFVDCGDFSGGFFACDRAGIDRGKARGCGN